jgi:hypothetical protein
MSALKIAQAFINGIAIDPNDEAIPERSLS